MINWKKWQIAYLLCDQSFDVECAIVNCIAVRARWLWIIHENKNLGFFPIIYIFHFYYYIVDSKIREEWEGEEVGGVLVEIETSSFLEMHSFHISHGNSNCIDMKMFKNECLWKQWMKFKIYSSKMRFLDRSNRMALMPQGKTKQGYKKWQTIGAVISSSGYLSDESSENVNIC